MAVSVPIDTRDITMTPVFKHITVEDVPASERAGHYVPKTMEVVEVRFAASKLYSPVFPVDAMWKREGHTIITYAERWADQYRTFLEGNPQEAQGTPLEMLKAYGITDSQLSLCRALKIYSIEALHHLEGQPLKTLQMNANPLKDMARKFMADRESGASNADEIQKLRDELAALKASIIPTNDSKPDEIEAAIAAADAEQSMFASMDDASIKNWIKTETGTAPRGNPSRTTLIQMAEEIEAEKNKVA